MANRFASYFKFVVGSIMTAVNSVSRLWIVYLTMSVCYTTPVRFTVFNVDGTTVPSVDDGETGTTPLAPDYRTTTGVPRMLGTTPPLGQDTVIARTTPASRPRQTQPSQQLPQPPPPPQAATVQQQPLPVAQQPITTVAVLSPVDQNDVPQAGLLPQSPSVSSVRPQLDIPPQQNVPLQQDIPPQPDYAPQLTTRPKMVTETAISQTLQQPGDLGPLPPPQTLPPQSGATNPPSTNPPQQVVEAEPAVPIEEDLPITTRPPSDLELLSETSEVQDSPPFTEPF
ncbi:unnamed protein product [Dicrocoelium dendriticum]|nr:unnamed protein product [Dicrocoelium dendriticum]